MDQTTFAFPVCNTSGQNLLHNKQNKVWAQNCFYPAQHRMGKGSCGHYAHDGLQNHLEVTEFGYPQPLSNIHGTRRRGRYPNEPKRLWRSTGPLKVVHESVWPCIDVCCALRYQQELRTRNIAAVVPRTLVPTKFWCIEVEHGVCLNCGSDPALPLTLMRFSLFCLQVFHSFMIPIFFHWLSIVWRGVRHLGLMVKLRA